MDSHEHAHGVTAGLKVLFWVAAGVLVVVAGMLVAGLVVINTL